MKGSSKRCVGIRPHYQEVIDSVLKKIDDGTLKLGDTLPSLNQVAKDFEVSRDTALVAYKKLKERGVIKAVAGKGYFVSVSETKVEYNIFLLFDELNSFKEDLYNAFVKSLGENKRIDIYCHHFNRKLFENLIKESVGNYTHYVIMPAQLRNVLDILRILPIEKTYILDQSTEELDTVYSSIFQNFEEDTYYALLSANKKLKKYDKLVMIHPGGKEPEGRKRGFLRFCSENIEEYEVISDENVKIEKRVLYITPSDRCLVNLIKQTRKNEWTLGTDIGLISFNDTPLKEVVADGITTISTDFPQMGKSLADLIKSDKKENIENQLLFIKRNSI